VKADAREYTLSTIFFFNILRFNLNHNWKVNLKRCKMKKKERFYEIESKLVAKLLMKSFYNRDLNTFTE
jgi:hypothetical protein